MKKFLVIAVALVMLTGCVNGLVGDGTKITVKNQESQRIKLTDALDELNDQYGAPTAHYRAYKSTEGEAHVIKDLYYTSKDGKTEVIVTVIDDEVRQIVTTRK